MQARVERTAWFGRVAADQTRRRRFIVSSVEGRRVAADGSGRGIDWRIVNPVKPESGRDGGPGGGALARRTEWAGRTFMIYLVVVGRVEVLRDEIAVLGGGPLCKMVKEIGMRSENSENYKR